MLVAIKKIGNHCIFNFPNNIVESIQLSEAEGEDLKWDLRSALGNQDPAVEDLPNTPIHLVRPLSVHNNGTYNNNNFV